MSLTPPAKTVPLTVIAPTPQGRENNRGSRVKAIALRLYRLAVVVAIVCLLHRHHARLQVDGDAPIKLEEVRPFFPAVARLVADESDRLGLFVLDSSGNNVGYVLRTSPISNPITGYAGPTDTLVALDAGMRVIGVKIRSSWDTKEHVRDVAADEYFMRTWNGKTWDQVAGLDPRAAGVEGVSGASLTSMGMANAIRHRFQHSVDAANAKPPAPRFRAHDLGLIAVVLVALVFTFTGHLRSHVWIRRAFQVVLIGYLGFSNGQLLAQSLLAGWTSSGVAWRVAPGLALLLAAALVVPWTSRRALYCSQICPHGAAQELLGRLTRTRLRLPRGIDAGLRWLPPLLVALVVAVTILNLPFDLAGIEPFDAYLVRTAGVATIAIAFAGLAASLFVPMAYCKYGCPTGAVLSFIRSHGKADSFGQGDLFAGILVLFAFALCLKYEALHVLIVG